MATLENTDKVIEPIRRNIILLAIRIFLVLFIADTIYAGLLLITVLGYVPSDWTETYTILLWVVHTLKNVIITYMVLQVIIGWFSTLYYVHEGHLIRQRGVLRITETVFQLTDIESIKLHQSWFGKVIDFGDVTITFEIARERQDLTLYAIDHPEKYKEFFSTFV